MGLLVMERNVLLSRRAGLYPERPSVLPSGPGELTGAELCLHQESRAENDDPGAPCATMKASSVGYAQVYAGWVLLLLPTVLHSSTWPGRGGKKRLWNPTIPAPPGAGGQFGPGLGLPMPRHLL